MSLSAQPFERHPVLASWIERLANSQTGLSLGEWMIFLGSLNAALDAARQDSSAERAEGRPSPEGEGSDDFFTRQVGEAMADPEWQAKWNAPERAEGAPAGEGLAQAVRLSAEKFRFYEQSHRAKGTLDGDEKAEANRQMAVMCEAALEAALASPPAPAPEPVALEFVHLLEQRADSGMVSEYDEKLYRRAIAILSRLSNRGLEGLEGRPELPCGVRPSDDTDPQAHHSNGEGA